MNTITKDEAVEYICYALNVSDSDRFTLNNLSERMVFNILNEVYYKLYDNSNVKESEAKICL